MPPFPPPLASLIAQFEAATAEARALAGSTTEASFTAREEKRWSAADCLAHLSTTNARYLRTLERLARSARGAESPRYEATLVGRLFKRSMEPPARIPLPAPKMFRPPAEARASADVLAEFEATQTRIAETVRALAGVDFTAVTVRSPFTPLLRFNLWDAFQIMAAHERRHLAQAQRAVEAAQSAG